MSIDRTRTLQYIKTFDLKPLFVEELGWDNPDIRQPIPLLVDTQKYSVIPLAKKAGMLAFNYAGTIPERKIRLKIYRELAKLFHEHLLIFTDPAKTTQRWLWIKRTAGRPDAARESAYYKGQDGELLFQKLSALAFTLAEEESGVGISDVVQKTKKAFDVDNVTKKFYDRFKTEHAAFLKFIEGIPGQSDREWYASLMLNRLMFVYFIQKKGFLDGDTAYLGNRLQKLQAQFGNDQFHSFYREFLLKLFHDGLGNQQRSPELEALLGKVPYLNGGLFDVHQLERENRLIQIPDDAFRRIFAFFDDYQWHLDERPLRNDREINPDVLGYIFEKYINQKQMGAYYTKEDITEYIAKNTIIPFLFDRAKDDCEIAFTPGGVAWSLLVNDPDRYIYEAVKKGTTLELPPEIAAGLNNVAERGGWNKPAPAEYALPTEIWREVVARRKRYTEIKTKLQAGELSSINDLITYNLNIRQFAQDVIESSEGPELVRAFYKAISRVTVLDPTCGSGAFLFAALNILEPLYSGCLERMQELVAEADILKQPNRHDDFRKTLSAMADHLNPRYFVLKSIIINNLYGVDIMEEAVEIAKLRLFLKLAAQVQANPAKANYGIEPLPDIDFNIRAGNTLVGFANHEEVKIAVGRKLDLSEAKKELGEIEHLAGLTEMLYSQFREQQERYSRNDPEFGAGMREAKQGIKQSLTKLKVLLDRYLAAEYGFVEQDNPQKYQEQFVKWQQSHQPFHWYIEFYGIMQHGGFDVIIGNPPYVEYSKVNDIYKIKNYRTEESGNLYAFVLERSLTLLLTKGRAGLIVPISLTAAQRMQNLQNLIFTETSNLYLSNFAIRPAALFPGVMQRLTICLFKKWEVSVAHTTDYLTWYSDERPILFNTLTYLPLDNNRLSYSIPKVNNSYGKTALAKILANSRPWYSYRDIKGPEPIYYHNAGGYWVKTFDFRPYYKSLRKADKQHTTISELNFPNQDLTTLYLCILNSNIFYFFWKSLTDARHVYPSDIAMLPINFPFPTTLIKKLWHLKNELMASYIKNSARIIYGDAEVDQFNVGPSKPIIDEIDRVLAQHYGFTAEELDFIINYDIKYRMGKDTSDDED